MDLDQRERFCQEDLQVKDNKDKENEATTLNWIGEDPMSYGNGTRRLLER